MDAATDTTTFHTAQRMEELGRIILAYSEVTEKLQRSHEQLTRTVQSLRAELSDKNRQLERRNRLAALGEMAAGLAHEIRNPLGAIQLYASVLSRDLEVATSPAINKQGCPPLRASSPPVDKQECPPSQALATVKKISGAVKRLEGLVTQVLQFTREIKPSVGKCDLATVVEQAVEFAEASFQQHGVTCQVEGPRPMNVAVDPLLVGQALLNLLRNAAEASGTGGTVRIRFGPPPADSEARQFHLIVRDSGPGIATVALDRIFNPFFTTKEEGTGLGLAIVHRVVEAHDGTIIVTNPPEGGAKFEIRI